MCPPACPRATPCTPTKPANPPSCRAPFPPGPSSDAFGSWRHRWRPSTHPTLGPTAREGPPWASSGTAPAPSPPSTPRCGTGFPFACLLSGHLAAVLGLRVEKGRVRGRLLGSVTATTTPGPTPPKQQRARGSHFPGAGPCPGARVSVFFSFLALFFFLLRRMAALRGGTGGVRPRLRPRPPQPRRGPAPVTALARVPRRRLGRGPARPHLGATPWGGRQSNDTFK